MCYQIAVKGAEIQEAFRVLNATKNEPGRSRTGRIECLEMASENPALRNLLRLACDPVFDFAIPDLDEEILGNGEANIEANWNRFHLLVADLISRRVTGPKAMNAARTFLRSTSGPEAEWYGRVLRRNLSNGLAAQMINRVWPNLVPRLSFAVARPVSEPPALADYIEPVYGGVRVAFILSIEPWTGTPVVSCYTDMGRPIPLLAEPIGFQLLRFSQSGVLSGELSIAGLTHREAAFYLANQVKSIGKQDWRQIYYSLRIRLYDYCSLDIFQGAYTDPTPFIERRRRLEALHAEIRAKNPKTSISLVPQLNCAPETVAKLVKDRHVHAIRFRKKSAGYVVGESDGLWEWNKREEQT